MAISKFIKTGLSDPTSGARSQAIVEIDGQEVPVDFWYEIIDQWGKEGAKQYLCAEALWSTGNYQDAFDLLRATASGSYGKDKDGNPYDTRNWQQNWIDNHQVPVILSVQEVDPLA